MKRCSLLSSLALAALVFVATSRLTPAWAQTAPTIAQRVASLDRALAGAKDGNVLIDDILYRTATIRNYRNRLAGVKSSSKANSITLQSTFIPTEIWEGGNVPYVFDPAIAPVFRENFLNAARQWEGIANLNFYPRTNETDYIYVYTDPGGGSFSFLGRRGGLQPLSLAFGDEIVAAHEIAHALGVEHEQSRSDRDEFVIINFDNIDPFYYNQYEKLDTSFNKGPYDFESIMHYFSLNSGFALDPTKETITTRLKFRAFQNIIGQRERISEGDKRGMVLVYGPPVTDTPIPTPTPETAPTPVPVATARPVATSTPRPPVEVEVPDNDNFANARPIDGESGEEFGDNLGATPESGEPEHAGASPTRSVWFSWTAPSSGIYSFATEGSSFDTVLAAYTGTAVSQLTRLAEDDDSGPTTRSLMRFSAQAGTTYNIVIDGFGVGRGEYQLNWRKVSDAPAPTPIPVPTPVPVATARPGKTSKPTPTPAITVASVIVSDVIASEGHEGTPRVAFAVTMTKAVSSTTAVSYRTDGGSATAGSDYVATSGTLIFEPGGETTQMVFVDIVPDTIREKVETFLMIVSSADAPVTDREGRATINDDDTPSNNRRDLSGTSSGRAVLSGGTG